MCINKLGIALKGYKDGAILLFRGTDMYCYVSQWKGQSRYAFDHTTHAFVAAMIEYHRKHGIWRDPALIKDGNDPSEAKLRKKKANPRKKEAEDSNGEAKEEVPRPRKRAVRVNLRLEMRVLEGRKRATHAQATTEAGATTTARKARSKK